jgi:hypothetical protein
MLTPSINCHSERSEELPHLYLLLPVFLFVIPQRSEGICFCRCLCSCLLFNPPTSVISTEAVHSTTVNRAAEKSASLPMFPPAGKPLSLLVSYALPLPQTIFREIPQQNRMSSPNHSQN